MATTVATTVIEPTLEQDVVPVDIPQYTELIGYLQQVILDARKYVQIVKMMQRGHLGLLKKSVIKKRRKPSATPNAPSGFNKPVLLSPEMSSFLGMGKNDLTSRTEVTKQLTKYFKENDLQNPTNRREILLDGPKGQPLKTLFPNLNGENLSFFNLQRHLKPHFVAAPVEGAPAPPVPEPESAFPPPPAVPRSGVKVVKKVVKK